MDTPRGIEVLVNKAAVDPAFKKLLLEKRAEAAEAIDLKLEPAEAAILDTVPKDQLRAIIGRTKVGPRLRPAFMGYAAGVMLAALGATTVACEDNPTSPATEGIRPDPPPERGVVGESAYGQSAGAVKPVSSAEYLKRKSPEINERE